MNPHRPNASWLAALVLFTLSLGLSSPPAATAQTNDLSLADGFPPAALRTLLIPRADWQPFPTYTNRAGWDRLPAEARAALIRSGEAAAAAPLPFLPATLYLGYAREGNRGRFEGPYFERRRRLHRLVLAECAEGRHRFRDAIADNLWALCEESTWCVPAHVGGQRAGVGLPDVEEPILDLFAAQTASSVAWTLYLLGAELDAVSPRLRIRAQAELNRRVLTPFQVRDFGWMGFGSRSRNSRPNNWNPWINGNVLTTALLAEYDAARRVEIVHRVLRSLDRFLQPYPSDGGCDEGPGYWSRAGGSVLDNLDLLHDATGGQLDVFHHPLIREMGRFIHRVHIAGDWYVALGDCAPRPGLDRGTVFRYGQRIDDPELRALATHGATLEELVSETGSIDLGRALRTLTDLPPILAGASAEPPLVANAWLGSDDLQMMIARDRAGSTRGLFVAAWGAHNAQSHNHNDVGNFVLFADGEPVFIDLGAPTYAAKTFSGRRYEIPAMQSAFHNLPTINGVLQSAGRDFAARDVSYRGTPTTAELTMDLAPAWPAEAKVTRWRRTVRLERDRELTLIEEFELQEVAPGAVLNLITQRQPKIAGPGRMELPPGRGAGPAARSILLLFDPSRLQATPEPFAPDDARLASVWGNELHRILVTAVNPVAQDRWELRMRVGE